MKNQHTNTAALFMYCRLQKKLPQRAMARLLKVHQSTICRVERGTIYPRARICKKLELLMEEKLSSLLSRALKAKNIIKETKETSVLAKQKEDYITNNDLSVSELDYDHFTTAFSVQNF